MCVLLFSSHGESADKAAVKYLILYSRRAYLSAYVHSLNPANYLDQTASDNDIGFLIYSHIK